MFQLLRRGFAVDFIAFLLVAVLVAAGVAGGLAFVVDAAFGDAVSHLLGQAGEYDVIVHLRDDSSEGSLPVVKELIRRRWPEADIHVGVRVAGNDNVFIGLPSSARRADVFENLPSLFSEVTGYNGHTWVVEPALTISGMRPGVVDILLSELAAIDGVLFPFRHGSRLTVVLEHASMAQEVAAEIEDLLNRYQVAEIYFPDGVSGGNIGAVATGLWDSLSPREKEQWVDLSQAADAPRDGLDAVIADVSQILELYASRVYPSPEADLRVGDRIVLQGQAPQAPQVGLHVDDLAQSGFVVVQVTGWQDGRPIGRIVQGDAGELVSVAPGRFAEVGYRWEAAEGDAAAGGRIGAAVGTVTVESPRYALVAAVQETGYMMERVGELAGQMEQVASSGVGTLSQWLETALNLGDAQNHLAQTQALLNNGGEEGTNQALIALLLSLLARHNGLGDLDLSAALAESSVGGGAVAGGGSNAIGSDPPFDEIKYEVDVLQQRIRELGVAEITDLQATVASVQQALPVLRDDRLSETLLWLDQYRGKQPGWSPALEIMLPAGIAPENIQERVQAISSEQVFITTYEAGILNPNPRATLLQVLAQVRQTLAGIIAIGLVVLILWADGGTLLHAGEQLRRLPGSGRNRFGRRRLGPAGVSGARGKENIRGERWTSGLWGAVLGAVLLIGVVRLSGGDIPGLTAEHIALLGAALGFGTGVWAWRISPIDHSEVVAGIACGLTPAQVMREIIIPEGRPGFLTWLNRWRVKMK